MNYLRQLQFDMADENDLVAFQYIGDATTGWLVNKQANENLQLQSGVTDENDSYEQLLGGNSARAQDVSAGGGSGIASFLPLIIILVVFWFFLIRPQMRQAKEHKRMVESLTKGDEVTTNGGLLGRINKVGDNFVLLEIAPNTEVKLQKTNISSLMPKGTIKTL